jgi:iron complex outermembrane recepter protein
MKICTGGLLAFIAAGIAGPALAQTAAKAGTEDMQEADSRKQQLARGAEEVIVTAQRREEQLQDVPISISVLSGVQLDTSSAQGVSEMLSRVPGVMATEVAPGGATQLQVRGVSASFALASGSSPVGYYLDSVPFGLMYNAILPDTNAYDLDRVEVLRGPQGTLYGANSMAGVVRVLTHDADLRAFEVKTRAAMSSTEGGSENYRGDMAINVPLVEGKLAARLVAGYQSLSGWLDKPNHKNANDAELSNLRLKINSQPTDELSIGLSIWRSRSDYGAPSTGRDNGTRSSLVDEPMFADFDTYGLKLGYDFSGISVTSMTSYLDYVNDSYADFRVGLGAGAPSIFHYNFPAKLFAQEFNVVSMGEGPWRWSLGGLYRDEKDETRYFWNQFYVQLARNVYTSESFAVFGELTRSFLDGQFELTAGLRYFEDHIKQDERSTSTGARAFGLFADKKFDSTTPRVVLTWHPNDQATVYASYAEGFRSGRAQSLSILRLNPAFRPIEPDTLKNYELGAKGSLWEGRLTFDSAIYYLDWQDVQQQISVFDPFTSNFFFTLINSESASGLGFDLGITAELAEGLTFDATYSTNALEVDTDVFSGGVLLFAEGNRPNLSPKSTVGAGVGYVVPLGGNGYEGRFSASVNYISSQTSRSITNGVLTVAEGDAMTVGRASFSINAPTGWAVTVFADNISNEEGSPSATPSTNPGDGDFRIRPRTIGAQFEYSFGQ